MLITPRVTRNSDEGREMTLEYARQFQSLAPLQKTAVEGSAPPPTPTPPNPPGAVVPEPATKPVEDVPNDQH